MLIELLDEQRRARYRAELQDAPPSLVRDLYDAAIRMDTDEAASLVRYVESVHGDGWRGGRAPESSEQVQAAVALHARIAETHAARIPPELDEAGAVIDEAARLAGKAANEKLHNVTPINLQQHPELIDVWDAERPLLEQAAAEAAAAADDHQQEAASDHAARQGHHHQGHHHHAHATRRARRWALVLELLARVAPGPTWAAWRALLKGLFALPMSPTEAATFKAGTARDTLPTSPAREAWIVAGRRSGKSRIAALLVTFLAAIRHWRTAPGERPMVLLLAPSRRQAGIVLGYVEAMLATLPGTTVTRRTVDELELSTGVVIRIESASFRTPRGFSIVGVVADEIAFWRDETGAAPDIEILRAVRRPLASVPGSLLIAISSPYSTRGTLYDTHTKHYGRADSDTLVWQSDSRALNPTLPQRLIDQALEEDPASASAEWLGVFRSNLESLFSREALAALVAQQRFELRPSPGTGYVGFCDPSGGSADSFTVAIAAPRRNRQGHPRLRARSAPAVLPRGRLPAVRRRTETLRLPRGLLRRVRRRVAARAVRQARRHGRTLTPDPQ